jgi:hypothetical protein
VGLPSASNRTTIAVYSGIDIVNESFAVRGPAHPCVEKDSIALQSKEAIILYIFMVFSFS